MGAGGVGLVEKGNLLSRYKGEQGYHGHCIVVNMAIVVIMVIVVVMVIVIIMGISIIMVINVIIVIMWDFLSLLILTLLKINMNVSNNVK